MSDKTPDMPDEIWCDIIGPHPRLGLKGDWCSVDPDMSAYVRYLRASPIAATAKGILEAFPGRADGLASDIRAFLQQLSESK